MEEKVLESLMKIMETLLEMNETINKLARAVDRLNDTIYDELLGEEEIIEFD